MRVLVVDDEEGIREVVTAALVAAGFECIDVPGGAEALLQAGSADVIVLDWMLPDIDGISVAEALRRNGVAARVLLLTARTGRADRLSGLAVADDFLSKPFDVDELVLRVRNLAERHVAAPGRARLHVVGPLAIDSAAKMVTVDGRKIGLTPTEFRLLQRLAENPGSVLERDDAYQAVWSYDFGGSRANLDTLVSGLRRKLRSAGFDGLETVRGFGYRLVAS